MLYYLCKYIHETLHWPGMGLFKYISFRSAMGAVTSFMITFFWGKRLIRFLIRKQIQEPTRNLLLDEEQQGTKAGTPTMGGLLIVLATIIPTLLFSACHNIYIILLLITMVWMASVGCLDDYTKVFKHKRGIKGWVKLLNQGMLGLVVSTTLYYHPDVVIRQFPIHTTTMKATDLAEPLPHQDIKSTQTTMPFLKFHNLDYAQMANWILGSKKYTYLLYTLVIAFIIAAVSNGANLTDGLDGLAASTSMVIGLTLAILAYLSGNVIFSKYLNMIYIPHLEEVTIFCSAFVGACMGFLWYNAYPAEIFMGDTGSLSIGAIIAVLAICIRKELLLPTLCGLFFIETLSVILQVGYFRYTKKRYGSGRRIFRMAPIHHHYQKLGWHESKIVTRFLITSLLFAIFTLISLKVR